MGSRIAAKALIIIALHLNFTGVCASPAPDESGSFNFLWENDAIAGTDHHYTNGVELSYLSIEDHLWAGSTSASQSSRIRVTTSTRGRSISASSALQRTPSRCRTAFTT